MENVVSYMRDTAVFCRFCKLLMFLLLLFVVLTLPGVLQKKIAVALTTEVAETLKVL